MLRDTKAVEGCVLQACDGEIGSVHDLLFDDSAWMVRYFVVSTGSWLSLRRVLIAPASVRAVDWSEGRLLLNLTRRQVKDSPDISADPPVSRQQEEWLRNYYAWPTYWETTGLEVGMMAPMIPPPPPLAPGAAGEAGADAPPRDPHLRSVREVRGYRLATAEGEIGHLEDLVVDDGHWVVDHLLANTRGWFSGGHVVVFPEHVQGIDWAERRVRLSLGREQLRNGPDTDAFDQAA